MLDPIKPSFDRTPRPNGLAAAMATAGVDAASLARRAGVNAGDIDAWARGQRDLRPAMATRLSAHLHTTAADLLIGLGCGEPPRQTGLLPCDETIAGAAGPVWLERLAGRDNLAETVLMLSAAILMGIVGCLAVLD
ncbi:hypothetical protein C5L14_11195 [Labrys okinawensis]|uniref:Uncharacterized protein n=1 Tax=Labrys okinawensis TaxID=346911 RepID=A0A2S9QCX4_9HYPH|nr:hypothetical protein [Labrys okinawensis]PRH87198.1 hypothetical protein C5L14_11195 [Labrys okinawensis]